MVSVVISLLVVSIIVIFILVRRFGSRFIVVRSSVGVVISRSCRLRVKTLIVLFFVRSRTVFISSVFRCISILMRYV